MIIELYPGKFSKAKPRRSDMIIELYPRVFFKEKPRRGGII